MRTTTYLKALSDDTRLRCFRLLALKPVSLCVAEFADILQRPQYAVSRALGELRKAGLVLESRQAKLIFYRLSDNEPVTELARWAARWCDCSGQEPQTNSDGSGQPGAEACAYDVQRLDWRLDTRGEDGRVVHTYPDAEAATDPRPRVLFVCIHNSARSQLAEEYLRLLAGDRYRVESGGLVAGTLNPWVVQVLAEEGIDISHKATQAVGDIYRRGHSYQWVITVCSREAEKGCPVFPGPVRRLNWPFADPADFKGSPEEILAAVRHLAAEVKQQIKQFILEQDSTGGHNV